MDTNREISNGVRVRFAPSPTGYLHIGGARTALFNWLYARHTQGKFILRIEDTDLERSKKEYHDEILNSLQWLAMGWDELYYQSQRFDIYREYADKLLKEGKAYTAENGAIIFKVEVNKIKITDLIRGEIEFDADLIKDQVLIKEDKSPTYNFACVIDDALLNITHVLRGDDHISNTPKQAVLYEALGFKAPKFAHLPLILDKVGGRMSKRTGATAVTEYRNLGYLPEAIVNYLMLLGWSPGGNQEIVDSNEAIKKFEVKNINKTAAVFDMDKLNWINAQYIKRYDSNKLLELVAPRLIEAGFIEKEKFDREQLLSVVKLFQTRTSTLNDFTDWAGFVFNDEITFDAEAKEKIIQKDLTKEFNLLIDKFERISDFNHAAIEEKFRELVKELGIKAGDLVHPVRIAISGKTVGPGLFETIALLGKTKTKERLTMAQKFWHAAVVLLIVFSCSIFSGCGTVKGAAEGFEGDMNALGRFFKASAQNIKNIDQKVQEHAW